MPTLEPGPDRSEPERDGSEPTGSPAGTPQAPQLPAPARAPRRGLRGVTFGLLALLAVIAVLAPRLSAPDDLRHVQAGPPDPVAPTGALESAFEVAREAALRIEARCEAGPRHAVLGVGSGFFASPDGGVLTAYHVVESDGGDRCPARYVAIDASGAEHALELIGFDAYFDLAWMRADVSGEVPYLKLATDAPRPGTEVVAIGNSRGDVIAPRAGRVTRLGVRAGRPDFADGTIEITAALAPGDSGGPVVTRSGEAVGVVSFISFTPGALQSDAYVPPFLRGVALPNDFASYAVPVARDADLVAAVRDGVRRDVPVIGFSWRPGFDYEPGRSAWPFGPRPGPVVVDVAPDGPADRAGLRPYRERPVRSETGDVIGVEREGDVIVAVDGTPTPTFEALLAEVRLKAIGETVTLTVQRGRATVRLDLVLGAKRDVFAAN